MGEPTEIVLIFASRQLGRADFRIGADRYSYSLDGAIVQRVQDLALLRPGAALALARERGTLITNERIGDMRRKDQEITNAPSMVADLTMWPGSTYSEGVGMKKLEKVLDEEIRKDVVGMYVQKFDDKMGRLSSASTAAYWIRGTGSATTDEEKQAIWKELKWKYDWRWAPSSMPG